MFGKRKVPEYMKQKPQRDLSPKEKLQDAQARTVYALTYSFGSDEHMQLVHRILQYLPPEQHRPILRSATKAIAKHMGLISKYTGSGAKRRPFPSAGDTGERPQYPYILGLPQGQNIR